MVAARAIVDDDRANAALSVGHRGLGTMLDSGRVRAWLVPHQEDRVMKVRLMASDLWCAALIVVSAPSPVAAFCGINGTLTPENEEKREDWENSVQSIASRGVDRRQAAARQQAGRTGGWWLR